MFSCSRKIKGMSPAPAALERRQAFKARAVWHPLRALFWIVLAIFFCVFHAAVPRAHFGSDEMMNLYRHWSPPLWRTIAADFVFWSKTIRPMGALYYLPLYRLFGLNPLPFNIARSLILLLNTFVFFQLAKMFARSWKIAALASFPIAYHAQTGNLHYDGAFIYDVLCGGFFFAAFLYYIRRRKTRAATRFGLTLPQTCVFLGLYICALDVKEMAVSLPVLILAWEILFRGRRAKLGPALVAGALTLIFILGKTMGPGALTELDMYRPVFNWRRFSTSNTLFLNTIFYTDVFTMGRVLALWGVLLYLGLRNWGLRKFDPRWLFLWVWVVVTPLPLAFLPDRGQATLYIVVAGWAMLAALAIQTILRHFARQPFAGLPRRAIVAAGLAGCIAAYWHETARQDRKLVWVWLKVGEETANAIRQIRELGAHPASSSKVVFLNDPFPGRWDTYFIAALVWRDSHIEIHLQTHDAWPETAIAKAQYIFDYTDGRFVEVKPAEKR
jgi:hypothetical protein